MASLATSLARPPGRRAAAADCVVSDIFVNSCRPWLGATAGNYPGIGSGHKAQVDYHETRIQRPLDIVHSYYGPGTSSLTADDLAYAQRQNGFLFANWKPAANWAAAGAGGTANATIDAMAASVKGLGSKKIFMTIWHEPENDTTSDPNCPSTVFKGKAGTPDQYKAMWANVRARFQAAGVTNVVWVMDYMNFSPWDCVVGDLYPGDGLVDWIVFNGYQTSETDLSWSDKVGRFYNKLATEGGPGHDYLSKPWGIVEWNSNHTSQPKVLEYYDQMKASVAGGEFPNLKAVMVFDSGSPDGSGRVGYDQNGNADPNEQAAYNTVARSASFTGGWRYGTADTTAPTVTLTTPSDGATVSGANVTVSADVSDDVGVVSANLVVDGGGTQTMTVSGGRATATLDSTQLPDASHALKVTATDGAGNTGSSSTINVTTKNSDTTAPSVPSGVQATSVDAHSISLSWTASTDDRGVAGYRVFRDGTAIDTVTADETTFLDEGLDPSSSHTYTVSAYDGAGNESARSAPASATTASDRDTTSPTSPGSFSATAPSSGIVRLTWTASTDNVAVTGYNLYRNGAPTPIATLDPATTSYDDTTVTGSTAYTYKLVAFDAAGNPSDPASTSVTTPDPPDQSPPTAPGALTATATSSTAVALRWNASTDNRAVTAYDVYRNGALLTTLPATATSYTDSPVSANTTFGYVVKARDAAGNVSPASNTATVTTPAPPDTTAPSVPAGLKATLSGSTVNLSWTASTDNVKVTAYKVYRDGVQVGTSATTSYQDTSAPQGANHTWTVAATDAAGNTSARSTGVTVKVPDTTPPGVPGSFAATVGLKTVTLTWTKPSDNVALAGYYLSRNGARIATLGATTTSYRDSNLRSGTRYTYQLVAVDISGNQSAPATVSATPR